MKLISEHDLVDGYFNQWFAFQEIYFAYVRKITVSAGKTPNTNENPNGMQYSDTKKNPEEFEDTKVVIRIRQWKKNRQHNDQKKKDKRTNNDLQNIHIKLKIE
jgi:hypothetical protein